MAATATSGATTKLTAEAVAAEAVTTQYVLLLRIL